MHCVQYAFGVTLSCRISSLVGGVINIDTANFRVGTSRSSISHDTSPLLSPALDQEGGFLPWTATYHVTPVGTLKCSANNRVTLQTVTPEHTRASLCKHTISTQRSLTIQELSSTNLVCAICYTRGAILKDWHVHRSTSLFWLRVSLLIRRGTECRYLSGVHIFSQTSFSIYLLSIDNLVLVSIDI